MRENASESTNDVGLEIVTPKENGGKEELGIKSTTDYGSNSPEKEKEEKDKDPEGASEAFSKLLDSVGGYGKWQWKYLFITAFCGNFTAFHNLGAAFLAYTPIHRCKVPGYENVSQISTELFQNLSIPWSINIEGDWEQSECEYYDRNYSQIIAELIKPNIEIRALDGGQIEIYGEIDGVDPTVIDPVNTTYCTSWVYDNSVFESTVVTEWDLVCDRKWLKSCAQSTYMGGILFGALVISELSDKYGRRTLGVISALCFLLASVATVFSQNYLMFLLLRFVIATFSSGVFLTNFVNCMESVSLNGRTAIGIFYHLFFATGICFMTMLGYLIRTWRYLQVAFSVPIITLLSYYWLLPESPRWLMMQGRHEEAMVIMEDIAKTNNGKIPPKNELDILLSKMVPQEKPKETIARKILSLAISFKVLLGTPNMRRRNLIMFYAWFVVSMIYYGLTFSSKNLDASVFLTVGLAGIVELPALFLCMWVLAKLGRRGTLCFVLIATSISCLLILAVPKGMTWLMLTLNTIGKLFMSPAFNVVFLMSAELVPTHVRNIAVGGSSMCARIGSGIAPFIVDLLGDLHYAVPSAAFGFFALTSGLLSFLLPETANLALPESIEEIEAMPR